MASTTINMAEAFPSRFLSGLDLLGKERTVTIESVEEEDMVSRNSRGREETSTIYVVYFVGTKTDERGNKRGLKLNLTRARILMKLYGPTTDNWIGKRITLYPENITAFGDVHCVASVRPTVPPPAKQKAVTATTATASEDDINWDEESVPAADPVTGEIVTPPTAKEIAAEIVGRASANHHDKMKLAAVEDGISVEDSVF